MRKRKCEDTNELIDAIEKELIVLIRVGKVDCSWREYSQMREDWTLLETIERLLYRRIYDEDVKRSVRMMIALLRI